MTPHSRARGYLADALPWAMICIGALGCVWPTITEIAK